MEQKLQKIRPVLGNVEVIFVNADAERCIAARPLRRSGFLIRQKMGEWSQIKRLPHLPVFDYGLILNEDFNERPLSVRYKIFWNVETTLYLLQKRYPNQHIGTMCINAVSRHCGNSDLVRRIVVIGKQNLIKPAVFAVTDFHHIFEEDKRVCDNWLNQEKNPFAIFVSIFDGSVVETKII